jgi:GDP-L-fucose synthase
MKKVLLTGGSGFIGKNILDSYLAKKYEIIAPESACLNLIDTDCVDNFFRDKEFDVILHAAVKPGHRNAKDPTSLFYSNLRMFQNLERHKDKYGKFINFGSGSIYDNSIDVSNAKEESICKNVGNDEHSFCKYIIYKQIKNLNNFIDLNIFGIFGKYEDWQIRFISNALCKTLLDLPITLRQNRKFSYLYIDDLMPILEFFMENNVNYKSYNIVPDETIELLLIAELVKKISKKNTPIKLMDKGLGLDYTGDNSRLKNEFKKIKFTPIEQSICELYLYYNEKKDQLNKELLLTDK